jgi:hypothetical protein
LSRVVVVVAIARLTIIHSLGTMSSAADEARLQNARETIDCMSIDLMRISLTTPKADHVALHDMSQLLQTGELPLSTLIRRRTSGLTSRAR